MREKDSFIQLLNDIQFWMFYFFMSLFVLISLDRISISWRSTYLGGNLTGTILFAICKTYAPQTLYFTHMHVKISSG